MSLPEILPTGAMSSGTYVDYMIGYLSTAMNSVSTQLANYLSDNVMDGWDTQWERTVDDINSDVTTLTSDFNKLKAQVQMAKDAISRL